MKKNKFINFKLFKNKAFIAFLCSFVLGAIIVVPNIIDGRGIYHLIADFNVQQIPFNKIINDSLKEGSFLWTWYNELGSNFIGAFSFYNLFSPFNIIGYLFPSSWFEYLIGPIFILKYAVAGLTSYLFMKRYVKNQNYAILGSILYSFSGFQLTNIMFYHFHDVVALFPLLLYGLDKLVYENKRFLFVTAVFLSAITNFFFFIGEVVFVIIYYIIKLITKSYDFNFKTFFNIVFEAIIGVGLASIVLIPSILFTMTNPRINVKWSIVTSLRHATNNYLEILRSALFPPEIMSYRAIITDHNYRSIELYLPFVGFILATAYFFKNKKSWDSIMMLLCCIIMCFPILNSMFFAFTITYYARWFYMPILIFCLTSVRCLDDKIKFNKAILINLLLTIFLVIGCLIYVKLFPDNQFFYDKNYLMVMIISFIFNILLLSIIDVLKNWNIKIKLIVLFVVIYICFWGNFVTYKYKMASGVNTIQYKEYLDVNKKMNLKKIARINSSDSCNFNIGLLTKNSELKSFNSNISGSLFDFYKSIDYDRAVSTSFDIEDKELNNFLGIEYIITCGNDDVSYLNYQLKSDLNNYKIYYNSNYKKLGFTVNKYITKKEFEKLDYDKKVLALNNSVVLTNSQVNKYKNIIKNNAIYEKNNYKFINNGLTSQIISNDNALAIYTIPYDEGWRVMVNGKNVKIENVDNGFIAIKINKGKNDIIFKYFPQGLKEGIIISGTSLLLFIFYVILIRKGKLV